MQNFMRLSIILSVAFAITLPNIWAYNGSGFNVPDPYAPSVEDIQVAKLDTLPLIDRTDDWLQNPGNNPFDLKDPSAIDQTIEYDPISNQYILTEKIGNDFYRAPTYMTFEEYMDWNAQQQEKEYWDRLAGVASGDLSKSGKVDPVSKIDVSDDLIDRLFGGSEVDLKPQGNVDLTFGYDQTRTKNPILPVRRQRFGGFDFDMDIQVNVDGKIGEKLGTSFNYNTQSTFDFENKLKLDYNSDLFSEDEIIKNIEAGDVSLPLRSELIEGSQNLFGIKTELQFGHLRLTAIASQQRSEQNDLVIQGGTLLQKFEVFADEYDENRHFFLSHFNRSTFEDALSNLPQIKSLFYITRIEVWVTNTTSQTTRVRDVVPIADLGEYNNMVIENASDFRTNRIDLDICDEGILPTNESTRILDALLQNENNRFVQNAVNTLTGPGFRFKQIRDFEKVRARQLSTQEYTVNEELGFVSLNRRLQNDEVLGVAYEYTYNGEVFQVGEFSSDIGSVNTSTNLDPNSNTSTGDQQVLFLKMLKSTNANVTLPYWDLMMKNFYPLNGTDINPEEFELDVYFEDPGKGFKRFLPDETQLTNLPLLTILNLDNLNVQGDPFPDGRFDFVQDFTIYPRQGRIMFPVLEPFGSSLENQIVAAGGDPTGLIYQQLYDSTIIKAKEFPEFNRYVIKGEAKSSSNSEISLGAFNIPQGSVRVTAGGQRLVENQDYVVDYNIGRLRILNDNYLQPGTPIRVSFEDNALFNFQKKTMIGLRADYELGKKANIGGTYMHLFERPFTQKVNIGDDPINNRVYGLDMNFSDESPFITKLVDMIPLIDTKEKSTVNFQAEVAALKPGHSKAINANQEDKEGVVYLDDFEGTSSNFDLRTPAISWQISATPTLAKGDNNEVRFPEAELSNSLVPGVNRALLNWYQIDRTVRGQSGPQSNNDPYTSSVSEQELFPNRQRRPGFNDFRTFDLAYYPNQRGPYNFDKPNGYPGISAGFDLDNCEADNLILNAPETRWAGITRELPNTDFEQSNYEAIEFWLCDPFINDNGGEEGKLILNFGTISEDVMADRRLFYEHGLPDDGLTGFPDTSVWGKIPRIPPLVNAFSNLDSARQKQDVGLDGLTDLQEANSIWYGQFIQDLANAGLNSTCLGLLQQDPANDNFVYFFNELAYPNGTDVFTRYKKFNGTQSNSADAASRGSIGGGQQGNNRVAASTNLPDTEDLNGDNTLQESEAYLEHVINLQKGVTSGEGNLITRDYVTDVVGGQDGRTWYRFRIPINEFDKKGEISDLRSIRWMRMYMDGWSEDVVLRFATLDLVRNQWRRLFRDAGAACVSDDASEFTVDAVNVEEHSAREPFNYVIPKGIQRERIVASTYNDVFQNEQALALRYRNFEQGCKREAYKILNLDMRVFERLQMFVHSESVPNEVIPDGAMSLYIRLGSDFENNYYEYEVPLVSTKAEDAMLSNEAYQDALWREANEVLFALKDLTDLKIERNGSGVSLAEVFQKNVIVDIGGNDYERTFSIKGNPTLGYVKNIMVGLRVNDGNIYNGEVWLNELRLLGLEERGGVAALARFDAQLADFGSFGVSTTYRSIGWGSIEKKLDDRAKEAIIDFDISTNLELGRFFGKEAGIRIPFYYQYSTTIRRPRFDPIDLDLDLTEKLARTENSDDRDSIRMQAQNVTTLKQINFTNVKKERRNNDKAPMPWDVSNFSLGYSFSKSTLRNEIVENDELRQHKGTLDYSYRIPSKPLEPLKNLSKSKWLKPITSLNFNPLPSSFTFSTILDRRFGQRSYRFADPIFKTWFDQRFSWDRQYGLNWDFTKSLKFSFNATNEAVIDELPVYQDRLNDIRNSESARKDKINEGLQDFGRTKNYRHNVNVTYNLPFKQFPFLDFIKSDVSYRSDYSWQAAALNADSLGNVIQNNQSRSATLDIDFTRLYDKSKFLAKINRKSRPGGNRSGAKKQVGKKDDAKDDKKADKEKKKKDVEPSGIVKALVRPLMAIRKVRLNYKQEFGTVIPGWTPESRLLGLASGFGAPGWEFIAGLQPVISRQTTGARDFLTESTIDGNLSTNSFQNRPIEQRTTESIDGRLTIEPFTDFKIDVDVSRNYTDNFSLFYKTVNKTNNGIEDFERRSPRDVGSFTMSYFSLQTLFNGSEEEVNRLFDIFEKNRETISAELGETNLPHSADGTEYEFGFGKKSQDVILPAFLSAYTNQSPSGFRIEDVFNWLPRPNWQLSYNGLHKTPLFKDIFKNVRLTHGYKSTLSINQYQTDLRYTETIDGFIVGQENAQNINTGKNYYSRLTIPSIVIQEQFSPLVGFEVKTTNDVSFNVDFSKRRTLSLNFNDNSLREERATAFDVGFGWVMKNVDLSWLPGYKKKKKKKSTKKDPTDTDDSGKKAVEGNDLEILFDLGFSDNLSLIHALDSPEDARPDRGSRDLKISPSIRYDINKNVNLRFFFDYQWSNPYTTLQFENTRTNGGVTVQIVLD